MNRLAAPLLAAHLLAAAGLPGLAGLCRGEAKAACHLAAKVCCCKPGAHGHGRGCSMSGHRKGRCHLRSAPPTGETPTKGLDPTPFDGRGVVPAIAALPVPGPGGRWDEPPHRLRQEPFLRIPTPPPRRLGAAPESLV